MAVFEVFVFDRKKIANTKAAKKARRPAVAGKEGTVGAAASPGGSEGLIALMIR